MLFSHPDISLKNHLKEVADRVESCCQSIKISPEFARAVRLAALLHDVGKATKFFQAHLKGKRVNPALSSHALLSAVFSLWHFGHEIPEECRVLLFAAIRFHHSNPDSFERAIYPKFSWSVLERQAEGLIFEELSSLLKELGLETIQKKPIPDFNTFKVKFSWPLKNLVLGKNELWFYFYTNLLLGMLVDADIRAVVGMGANEKRHKIPEDIVDRYIEKLPKNSPIDPLRQEFYKTVIDNIQRLGLENRFLSLTAPTGIGKTLAGFSAAVRLRNMIQKENGRTPRIIYVLPFTSIIDQNFDVIGEVIENAYLPKEILLKHHFRANPTRSDPKLKTEDVWKALEEDRILRERDAERLLKRYEQAHTRVETWDGEVIITTFVRFYETLFTNRRSEMRRLHRLAGSVVILDEVQNIPPKYWEATEKSLQFLAEQWDTRFILMTATRPALLRDAPELTQPNKKFFFSKLSRTKLHINHEPSPYMEIDHWLLPKVKSAKSFMVVMNTVRSAQEVYETLKEELSDYELYFLSASLIPVHREARIREIKEKLKKDHRVALVATQVVEAGVDLDFDVVIRDLAPLDSIVQAAGRCNRNARTDTGGRVFLMKLTNPEHNERRLASYIYDGVLIQTTEEIFRGADVLSEKKYLELVEEYFYKLRFEGRKASDKDLLESVEILRYDELGMFGLLEKGFEQVPVFVEFDERAEELIEKLQKLKDMPARDYQDRMNRRRVFKSIAPELWGYVVNVPIKVAAEVDVTQLPYASSFLWLPRAYPNFDKIYREDTGFTRKIEHEAIFL